MDLINPSENFKISSEDGRLSKVSMSRCTHFINFIITLRWESLEDKQVIIPNLTQWLLYIHKYSIELMELFGLPFDKINMEGLIDTINTLILHSMYIQIHMIHDSGLFKAQIFNVIKPNYGYGQYNL